MANIGLELHAEKTRIITTASETKIVYIDVDGDMVQVVAETSETHMYFGRKIPTDLRTCSVVEVAHRINAAGRKFNKFRYVLTNQHVSIKRPRHHAAYQIQSSICPSPVAGDDMVGSIS